MSKVTEWIIRDNKVVVTVDSIGNFSAEVDEVAIEAKTLAELKPKVEKAIKRMIDNANPKKQVGITVLGMTLTKDRYDPLEKDVAVIHARLRGKHGRNHEYLFTAESGQKFKLRSWGNQHCTRRLTPALEAEYLQLAQAQADASKALEAWEKKHVVSMETLLGAHDED